MCPFTINLMLATSLKSYALCSYLTQQNKTSTSGGDHGVSISILMRWSAIPAGTRRHKDVIIQSDFGCDVSGLKYDVIKTS